MVSDIRWPVAVDIQHNELLSSWLIRTAEKNGCSVTVLTHSLWPEWRCWSIDIDRELLETRMEILSSHSGMSKEKIANSTLFSTAKLLTNNVQSKVGIWPWISSVGSRNTKRRGGLAFCPKCLSGDDAPYYRKSWRLAWHTTCDVHKLILLDCCPSCRTALMPHLNKHDALAITTCSTCLRCIDNPKHHHSNVQAHDFQISADNAITHGQQYFHGELISTDEWFKTAAFYLALIKRAHVYQTDDLRYFFDLIGVELTAIDSIDRGIPIETMSICGRHNLLSSLSVLVRLSSDTIITNLRTARVTRAAFVGDHFLITPVLASVAASLPSYKKTQRKTIRHSNSSPLPKKSVLLKLSRLERRLKRLV